MQIEVICVLVLPILFGPYGIWYAVIAAEIFALVLSIFFLIRNRKKIWIYLMIGGIVYGIKI